MTYGMIVIEIWWTNQEFSPVDIIPPWFSMLVYHLGNEQYAHWWPQFRDVVSPHRRDHHYHRVKIMFDKLYEYQDRSHNILVNFEIQNLS
jgi:hypothetical protein